MFVSQKAQYALRALFELSLREDAGPVKIADIAEAQNIPVQFLTVILGQLKQGGFVESQRGKEGGYLLRRSPARLVVGEILGFMQGPDVLVDCLKGARSRCAVHTNCVFFPMWKKVERAIYDVLDATTLESLVNLSRRGGAALDYAI